MARLKKHEANQAVRQHIGINSETHKVEWVSETRGGQLSLWRNDNYITHSLGGRDAQSECVIIFGLTDIYSIPIEFYDSDGTKKKVEELKAKAEAIRIEAESLKTKS